MNPQVIEKGGNKMLLKLVFMLLEQWDSSFCSSVSFREKSCDFVVTHLTLVKKEAL